jgi:Rad3-related DNA helicase
MNNFPCLVKEDFIKNNIYECGVCSSSINQYCSHTTVGYGPCLIRNNEISMNGCIYKTAASAYEVSNRGTKNEEVLLNSKERQIYQDEYSKWLQIKGLKESRKEWAPCGYYDQLNIARNASHSIFNYAMFLTLLPNEEIIPPRQLLVLDEGHLLETEIVNLTSFILSKSKWRKYIPGFSIIDYGYYDSIEAWIDFLVQLEAKMLALLGDLLKIKELVLFRKQKYNYKSTRIIKRITNTKITDFIAGEKEEEKLKDDAANNDNEIGLQDSIAEFFSKKINSKDLEDQARLDTETLTLQIDKMLSNSKNWIVYDIKKMIILTMMMCLQLSLKC